MRASARKPFLLTLGLAALGLVVYELRGFLHLGGFSGAKLLQAVREANAYYLVVAITAIYACYGIRSLRWQIFSTQPRQSRSLENL